MMAAGFTFFDIWKMLGDSMFLWEWMREIEGKEEDLVFKIVPGSRIFSFRYAENARFSGLLGDWRE